MNDLNPDLKHPRLSPSGENPKKELRSEKPGTEKSKRIDFRNFTLLVVDDEADLREAIVFDFKRKGFTVLSAKSGMDALELLKANRVDLIISDVRMPEGDGIFLLEKIQSLETKIPLIFVTGFTDYTEAECVKRGALKVIAKPFDRKALMSSVIEALAASKRG